MKNNRLFFNCLRERHSVRDCHSQGRCQICSLKHHTSVSTDKKKENAEDADQTSVKHTAESKQMNVSLVPTCTSIHTGPVPLKLATSKISHGNKQIDVNIDKGVQRTYVTESAIKKLSIHDTDCKCEFLNISTFGSSVSQQKHVNIAQIKLHTRKPGEKLNNNALIVPPNIYTGEKHH